MLSKVNVATDSVTLSLTSGQPISFPQILFGCDNDNKRAASRTSASGIIAFGPQYTSFLSQIGPAVGKKFSYCMVPSSSSSKRRSELTFGSSAIVQGPGAVSSPMTFFNGLYFLALESYSGGMDRYELEDQLPFAPSGGNTLINSVSTPALFQTKIYSTLESAVTSLNKLP